MENKAFSASRKLVLAALASLSALISPAREAAAAPDPPCVVDGNRELWIRDLSVVNDPVRTVYTAEPASPEEGVWSFGRLIENLAPGLDPTEVVLHLFDELEQDQIVNGHFVPGRTGPRIELLEPWIARSPGFDKGAGLDFSKAPFRLLGIVNRLDLRDSGAYGLENAGEGRIVFGGVNLETGSPMLFTIIFEYELLAGPCGARGWAEAWHALGQVPLGPSFNKELQVITDAFSGKGVAPGRPNDSAIKQVRTNELLVDLPWQWREFHLSGTTHMLELATVAQTPATSLLGTPALASFINDNQADILAGTHVVPETWQGAPFLGGSSDGNPFTIVWNAPGILDNEARHRFALQTCNGCHTDETGTTFFQATPRNKNQVTPLSGFLLGTEVPDPVDPSVTHKFGDLRRRARDLCRVLASSCFDLATEEPLSFVH